MSIESMIPSNCLILCLSLLLLPSVFPSIRVSSSVSALCIRWPKYWNTASASVLPVNIQGWFSLRLTGLISLLSSGLFKSHIQLHSLKALVLQCSAFFMVLLSHPYMITGKTIVLIIHTFVIKVISLLFNTLSRFVIAFLLRSNCLLISWLQSQSTVTLEPKNIKSDSFHFFPIYLPWSDGTRCHDS